MKILLTYMRESTSISKVARIAFRAENTSMLTLLLEFGADINACNANGKFGTAIEECAYYGNIKMAKFLCSCSQPPKINKTGGRYHTPLIASVCLAEESAKDLHNSRGKRQKFTQKRLKRHEKMFDSLLSKDADVKQIGGKYGNVLNASAACASLPPMEYVIDRTELLLDWVDQEGRSVAHMACVRPYGSTKNLSFLVKRGGEKLLMLEDKLGRRPLHFASASRNIRLNKVRIDVDARDQDGWTPLHWACRSWRVEVIRVLLANGADPSPRTKKGWTPWHVALYHDNGEFEDILHAEKYPKDDPDYPDLPKKPGRIHMATCDSCFVVSISLLSSRIRC